VVQALEDIASERLRFRIFMENTGASGKREKIHGQMMIELCSLMHKEASGEKSTID